MQSLCSGMVLATCLNIPAEHLSRILCLASLYLKWVSSGTKWQCLHLVFSCKAMGKAGWTQHDGLMPASMSRNSTSYSLHSTCVGLSTRLTNNNWQNALGGSTSYHRAECCTSYLHTTKCFRGQLLHVLAPFACAVAHQLLEHSIHVTRGYWVLSR